MKENYQISGMTCNGCRAAVENDLNALPEISHATVDLESEQAVVESNSRIPLEKLQAALSDKYRISEVQQAETNATTQVNSQQEQSKFQQLKPLFLILLYISVASLLINRNNLEWGDVMLDFMGLFYIVFSFFKMLDLKGFPDSFRMYDPLAKAFPAYGWVYPFIETALGLMLLMRFQVTIALIITLVILGITTVGVSKTLLDKRSIRCACLGTALNLPMTEATFIENAIMIVMAGSMLFLL